MRRQGWENMLAAHVADARARPFVWGQHDCALWCAQWVLICTGRNHVDDWKGLYSTEEELNALLASRGYADHIAVADSLAEQKPLAFARRGDVLLHPSGTLGICVGSHGIFVTQFGVIAEATMGCIKAWGVD